MNWNEAKGHGQLRAWVEPETYDAEYFAKYSAYADTELGRKILNARIRLVDSMIGTMTPVLDVGVGCGAFVAARATYGYDVGVPMVAWLRERHSFFDPFTRGPVEAMTFWDSLEHIVDPAPLLKLARQAVFVSIPIFRDREHALSSKHFRPNEHWHYFTENGFILYMREQGFSVLTRSRMEEELGREDIHTFAFWRSIR